MGLRLKPTLYLAESMATLYFLFRFLKVVSAKSVKIHINCFVVFFFKVGEAFYFV